MSYTEYLRRKEAAAPKVIDTTLRLDASSYTQRVKFASSRMINETNLKETDQVDVPGLASTIAGSATNGNLDGIGTAAQFGNITSMCIDPAGLNLYITESTYSTIKKMVISTRQVSTIAGGTYGFVDGIGAAAQFRNPIAICIDPAGLNLYVTDRDNHKIRKIVISTGEVSTFAGSTNGNLDGFGTAAQISSPDGISIDSAGLNLYVTAASGSITRKIIISTAEVITIKTSFQILFQCIDPAGLNLYCVTSGSARIQKLVISTGVVSTIAGSGTAGYQDGIGTAAQFQNIVSIAIDPAGLNLYVPSDYSRIRKIVIATGEVTTLAGGSSTGLINGSLTSALFSESKALVVDTLGANLYMADNYTRIRSIFLPYTFYPPIISVNKTKSGGRIPDASTFTQYAGGQAVGKEVQAGMPARRLLLNSNSAGSLTGCRIVPEPVPYNPAVGGVYTANMVPRDASQFTRDETACRELTGEPHNRNELGPSVFVDNTIVGVKNYNLPQNNSKTYTATKCTQCGNNGSQLAKTCTFCIGANHLHPADKPTNTRWGPRPRKSAQPIIVNQSPSDFHKVGAAMRKIPYVEKHHANPQIGHIVYPKTPYRIPRGTAAQLKINDPQRYPGTM